MLQLFSFPSGDPSEFEQFGPKEYAALEFLGWFQSVGGYNQMNGTRPQTIAAALSDSPVGQLAYNELFENFGNGTSLVSRGAGADPGHALLADQHRRRPLSRYHYAEGRAGAEPVVSQGRIGVAVFAHDFQTIRPLAERDNANIVHWSEFDRGGHYAALEVPDAGRRRPAGVLRSDRVAGGAAQLVGGAGDDPVDQLLAAWAGRRSRRPPGRDASTPASVSPSTSPALSIIGVLAASVIWAEGPALRLLHRAAVLGELAPATSRSSCLNCQGPPQRRARAGVTRAGLLELLDQRRCAASGAACRRPWR